MAVLSRLFNKKRPEKTLEEKIAELPSLSVEALVSIAIDEGDESLRTAAISQLDYGQPLRELAYTAVAALVQISARQRLANLIDSSELEVEQLRRDTADDERVLSVLGFSERDDLVEQILGSATDHNLLVKISLGGSSVRLRQIAAEKVEDEESLKQLLKESKGKDKAVYKIVKEKCDRLREQAKQSAAVEKDRIDLCVAIEFHSTRSFDKLYGAKLIHLREQWSQFSSQAPVSLSERAEQGLDRCQQLIDADLEEKANQQARVEAIANVQPQREALLKDLRGHIATLFQAPSVTADQSAQSGAVLAECDHRWEELKQLKSVSRQEQASFAEYSAGIADVLKTLERHGALAEQVQALQLAEKAQQEDTCAAELGTEELSAEEISTDEIDTEEATEELGTEGGAENVGAAAEGLTDSDVDAVRYKLAETIKPGRLLLESELPAVLLTARRVLEDYQAAQREGKLAQKNLQRQITTLIRKANNAVTSGQSRQAQGIRRRIAELIGGDEPVGPNTLPEFLLTQLAQLDEAMSKLQDWRRYAVEPKKQQLLEQMQALIDRSENPEALAVKIKRLQDQWKELSRGGGDQDQALWEAFRAAGKTAYQPCAEYFGEQAKDRQNNLQKRQQLVEQLRDYYNASGWIENEPAVSKTAQQWTEVEKLLRLAREEWRSHSPVERAAIRPVQAEYDKLLGAIQDQLQAEYVRNCDLKRALLERASKLLAHEDNRRAVDEVKRLQSEWKQVGITPRKDDQKLWKEFRAHCDGVFDKRQQETAAFKEELNVNRLKACELTEQVASLSQLSSQPLLEARKTVDELQQQFKALGSLPKAKSAELNSAFYAAVKGFDERIRQQRNAAKEQVWVDFLRAGQLVSDLQRAIISEGSSDCDKAAAARATTQQYIEGVLQWPKGGLKCIEDKLAAVNDETDFSNNEVAMRTLCIQAEILTDTATPAEDQSLRMEYQVNKLQQGLGQFVADVDGELKSLVFDWVMVGAVEPGSYSALLDRFNQCRSKSDR